MWEIARIWRTVSIFPTLPHMSSSVPWMNLFVQCLFGPTNKANNKVVEQIIKGAMNSFNPSNQPLRKALDFAGAQLILGNNTFILPFMCVAMAQFKQVTLFGNSLFQISWIVNNNTQEGEGNKRGLHSCWIKCMR